MRKIIDRIPDGTGGYFVTYADEETVSILGADYVIHRAEEGTDVRLRDIDGLCDDTLKEIAVKRYLRGDTQDKGDLDLQEKKALRHEILHAFLFESGLAENSTWAQDEETVDWFAIQGPKIIKAWQEAEAL